MVKISSDTKQKFKSIINLFSQGYKVLMASLLSVFVPQQCPVIQDDLSSSSSSDFIDNITHGECSMKENFMDLIPYNVGVLIINFITLGLFIGFYILEFYRENWLINYLDTDINKSYNNLKTEIEEYPEYKKKLIKLNKQYYIYSYVLLVFNIINFAI